MKRIIIYKQEKKTDFQIIWILEFKVMQSFNCTFWFSTESKKLVKIWDALFYTPQHKVMKGHRFFHSNT